MGVGNWSIRSPLPTDVVHVDSSLESFSEYQARATESVRRWIADAHPELSAQFGGKAELADIKDLIPRADLNDALAEEGYSFWEDDEGFYRDQSVSRYDDFVGGIQHACKAEFPLAETQGLKRVKFWGDAGATVLARTPLAMVVVREWESSLCIGIAPSEKLENGYDGTAVTRAPLEAFLARVWSVCDPKNESFRPYAVKDDPIARELRPTEKDSMRSGEVMPQLLSAMVERLSLHAQAAVDLGHEADFLSTYGFPADDLVLARSSLDTDIAIEFMAEFNATSAMLDAQYLQEFSKLQHTVLNAMANMDEKPYRPNGPWTSAPVDLSAYRVAVPAWLDGDALAKLMETHLFSDVVAARPASSYSVMGEHVFNRTVVGAVQSRFPFEIDLMPDSPGMLTVCLRSEDDRSEGVAVWRGHPEWLGFTPVAEQSKLLRDKRCERLGDLPGWMSLCTDDGGVRDALDALGAPAALAKEFFNSDGECQVTGVLAETRDGEYGAFFVCYGGRPFDLDAAYEVVLLNGQWAEPDVAPQQEPNHG